MYYTLNIIIYVPHTRVDLKINLIKTSSNDIVKYHYVFRYDYNIIIIYINTTYTKSNTIIIYAYFYSET